MSTREAHTAKGIDDAPPPPRKEATKPRAKTHYYYRGDPRTHTASRSSTSHGCDPRWCRVCSRWYCCCCCVRSRPVRVASLLLCCALVVVLLLALSSVVESPRDPLPLSNSTAKREAEDDTTVRLPLWRRGFWGQRRLRGRGTLPAPGRPRGTGGSATRPARRARPKGSVADTWEALRAMPPEVIPSAEARDVFLFRPNWRRAALERRRYVYYGVDTRGRFDEAAYAAFAAARAKEGLRGNLRFAFRHGDPHEGKLLDNINAKDAREDEDDEQLRVFIVFYSDKLNDLSCGLVSSSYVSSLPINHLGYRHEHANNTDKVWETRRAAHRAGLRPQDVILFLDSDVLMLSGTDILRGIDRFIRYSPESPQELDARDVRDDAGEMLAPLLYSAEHNCMFIDFTGNQDCAKIMRSRGLDDHGDYLKETFPGSNQYTSAKEYFFRYLNSGGMIARMWAYDEFAEAFRRVVVQQRILMTQNSVNGGRGWKSDQSAVGAIWVNQAHHEVLHNVFHPRSFAKGRAESREYAHAHDSTSGGGDRHDSHLNGSHYDVPSYPRDNLGLRLGLIGLDHYNELFHALHVSERWSKLTDRYLQAAATAATTATASSDSGGGACAWLALQHEQQRMLALSYQPKSRWRTVLTNDATALVPDGADSKHVGGAEGGGFTLEVSRRYFAIRSTRTDGLEGGVTRENGEVWRPRVLQRPYTSYKGHCLVEALYRVSVGIASPAVRDQLVATEARAWRRKRALELKEREGEVDDMWDEVLALRERGRALQAQLAQRGNAKRDNRQKLFRQRALQQEDNRFRQDMLNAETRWELSRHRMRRARQKLVSAKALASEADAIARASANVYGEPYSNTKEAGFFTRLFAQLPTPNATTLNCFEFAKDACSPSCSPMDWFAQPRHVVVSRGGGEEEEGAAADAVPNIFLSQPLHLSRRRNGGGEGEGEDESESREVVVVQHIRIAPPVYVTPLFHESNATEEAALLMGRGRMVYQVPAVMHTPGATKTPYHESLFYMAPWAFPLYYGFDNRSSGEDPEAGIENVKRFLRSMPLQLWGDDFRTTLPYREKCDDYMNRWFMNRRERALRRPWPRKGLTPPPDPR